MLFAVLASALTEKLMFPLDSNSTRARASGLERKLASSQPAKRLRRRWVTLIMTGSELNKCRVLVFLLATFCLCESAMAQSNYSLRSPDQRIEVRIRTDRFRYDVLLNGSPLLQ